MNLQQALFISACAATVASAQTETAAKTHYYVRPSYTFAILGDDFKEVGGYSVATGVSFLRHHSIEAEYVRFKTRLKGYSSYGDLQFTPIVASYKYAFGRETGWGAYVGGSLGVVQLRTPKTPHLRRDESFTLGTNIGGRYAFNEHLAAELSLKVLAMDDTRFTTAGTYTLINFGFKAQF